MITDIKTNIISKFFFLTLTLIGFYSCNNSKPLVFEKQNLKIDTLINCKKFNCDSVKINLLNIADNDEISKSINQEVEKTACTVINIGRVEPHKTLKKAIDEFHDSYLNLSNKYPEGIKPPYGIFIDYEKSFQNNDIISLKMKSQIHEGGLSRNDKITYLNINTKTGKQIINDELIKDHKLFNDYAEKIIRNQYNITQNKPFRKFREVNIFFDGDRFYLPKNIGITDKEVILYYNPNEINVSTEDGIVLKLNKQEVAPFFTINIL